jgi:uncharacterized membrane protein
MLHVPSLKPQELSDAFPGSMDNKETFQVIALSDSSNTYIYILLTYLHTELSPS